jgi:hypothetical protein
MAGLAYSSQKETAAHAGRPHHFTRFSARRRCALLVASSGCEELRAMPRPGRRRRDRTSVIRDTLARRQRRAVLDGIYEKIEGALRVRQDIFERREVSE